MAFNPYFLNGIAYKYDSPGMAAAILFPLVPFLFVGAPRLYAAGSFFCLLAMYLSYQSASGIYVMMAVFVALLKYLAEEWSLRDTAKFCAKSAGFFAAATAAFFLLSRFLTAGAYRSTGVSIGLNVPRNIARCLLHVMFNFNSAWIALSLLVAGSAAIAVCRLSKKRLPATLALFALALVLSLALSQGSYIFLSDYFDAARGKYGFGVLLAILASISVMGLPSLASSCKRALAAAPAVLLAWSFFSYASAFGNAHANQMKMELQYEALVRQDISALFPQEEYPEIDIAFVGKMPWSGEVKNLVKAYPITEALVFKRPGYWLGLTSGYFDGTLRPSNTSDFPVERPLTLLLSRRYYSILMEEGTGRVVVEGRME